MPHFTTWPPELGSPKAKFVVEEFKFAKTKLTGPETRLVEKYGTLFQGYEDPRVTTSSTEYEHFMKVLRAFEERSISSADAYRDFIKEWTDKAEPLNKKERAWFKYRTIQEEAKRLKEEQRRESIRSPERDEYIKSRLLP